LEEITAYPENLVVKVIVHWTKQTAKHLSESLTRVFTMTEGTLQVHKNYLIQEVNKVQQNIKVR